MESHKFQFRAERIDPEQLKQKKRVQISLSKLIYSEIEKEALQRGISKSGLINMVFEQRYRNFYQAEQEEQ